MKRSHLLLSALIFTIVVLSVTQITISNMLSTGGITLSKVNLQIQDYQRQNAILKQEMYMVASFDNISKEAEKLGYVDGISKSTLVITDLKPLAIKP